MTTYQIVTVANEWTIRGEVKNRRDVSVIETDDPIVAGKAYANQNTKLWGAEHAQHVEVRAGIIQVRVVEMVELYAAVIGPELFEAQDADESFSINLDDFFKSL